MVTKWLHAYGKKSKVLFLIRREIEAHRAAQGFKMAFWAGTTPIRGLSKTDKGTEKHAIPLLEEVSWKPKSGTDKRIVSLVYLGSSAMTFYRKRCLTSTDVWMVNYPFTTLASFLAQKYETGIVILQFFNKFS